METTTVFSKNVEAYIDPNIRVIVNKGSTRSSKTWSVLQLLYFIAKKSTKPRLISIVSESMPHLKRGCIRDFENMLKADKVYNIKDWNATDKIYRVGESAIEFFSADTPDKVHGPARDVLYINECINIEYEVYRQLAIRTTEKIILDYNPCHEFWVDSKILVRPEAVLIHSTYKDNDMLSASQIKEIESNRAADPEWWKVYGLGETGSKEGLVMRDWDIVPSMPHDFKKEWIGIDFGYGDPTAIAHIRMAGGEIYIDQLKYESKLDNPTIAQIIKDAGLAHVQIVADCAEPKSIRELKNEGLHVDPAEKGADSINLGIQIMNRYRKHYTKRSVNFIEENRKYRYASNPNGDVTNKPVDKYNHSIDAVRYVFLKYLGNTKASFDVTFSLG